MTSSRQHTEFTARMQIVKGHMAVLDFKAAAIELLAADKKAVHAGDMYEVEVTRDELTELGVNWRQIRADVKHG